MRRSAFAIPLLTALFAVTVLTAGLPVFRAQAAAGDKAETDKGPKAGPGDMWDPHWMQRQIWGPRDMEPDIRPRMNRHWTFMNQGIDEEYMRSRNPFDASKSVIAAGRALYTTHCASCHGARGLGDGDSGKSLSPSPALLAYLIQMPMTVDSYLLWTISEGGVAFDTAMPSFKATLPRDDIWKIVTFMRSGFPKEESGK